MITIYGNQKAVDKVPLNISKYWKMIEFNLVKCVSNLEYTIDENYYIILYIYIYWVLYIQSISIIVDIYR